MLRNLLLTLLSLTLLTGCGFRVQQNYLFPEELSQIQLDTPDEYGELTRLVKEDLRQVDIQVVDDPKAPRLWLGKDNLERATLSLFPSGQVAEYELIYSVKGSITIGEHAPQLFTVEVRRDYLDDPRTALAKNRELELLLKEMRQQASDRILRNLASARIDNGQAATN